MPFPLAPIVLISLEVTRALVALGFGLGFDTDAAAAGKPRFTATPAPATGMAYPALPIIACTGLGVSPIVVTTAYPHGVSSRLAACGGLSCVITGVTGNTAANNPDLDPESRFVSLPAGILAVPLSPTTLALYGQNSVPGTSTYGALIPLIGNGTYISGGTIVPALTDGSLLIGRPTTREWSAAPRICLVPKGIATRQGKASSPNYAQRNTERQALIRQRPIAIDTHQFDVHAWGEATPPDAANDYAVTMALRDCVQSALYDLAVDAGDTGNAVWDDEKERATQIIKSGHLLTFGITLSVPVTDNPFAGGLEFLPAGTTFDTTVQSTTPETAQEFTGPTITPG